jgi:hypothetical protein
MDFFNNLLQVRIAAGFRRGGFNYRELFGKCAEQSICVLAARIGKDDFDQCLLRIEGAHEGQAVVAFEDETQVPDLPAGQSEISFAQKVQFLALIA